MVTLPEYEAPELSYLHPSVRDARLPANERVEYVRADRWIGYPRAMEAVARLESLLSWPDKQRMPNLLLIGPTNNGKSMIIEKFRRTHPPMAEPSGRTFQCCACRCRPSLRCCRFYTALLAALGAPMRARYRLADVGTDRAAAVAGGTCARW